jgi:hypothetical protein
MTYTQVNIQFVMPHMNCEQPNLTLTLLFLLQHRNTQETLAVLDRLDLDTDKPSEEEVARKFGFEEAYVKGHVSWWQQLKPQIWSLFDEPYSSNAAKVRINTTA